MKFNSWLLTTISILSFSILLHAQTPNRIVKPAGSQAVQMNKEMFELPVDGSIYKIRNAASGRYAQIGYGSVENGATVHLYDNGNEDHYKWTARLMKEGYFKFENVKSGKCLAILGGSKDVYGVLCQWKDEGQADILWKPIKTANGFKIKNRNSPLVMGVEGGSKANGAKLIQWTDDGGGDKDWQFELVTSSQPQGATPMKPSQPAAGGPKVLVDIILDNIGVSETTRNRIDNGDCKRVFGTVKTELWQLNDENEMKTKLISYNNMPEFIFNQLNYQQPPPVAYSYYQEKGSTSEMGKVTYNVPLELLKQKKLMLVVKTNVGTRHKDNDFASYDCLRMSEEKETSFILDEIMLSGKSGPKVVQVNTDQTASSRNMHIQDLIIPGAMFQRTDDTHNIWLNLQLSKK